MSSKAKIVHFHKTRFSQLATRSGGVGRTEAVARASDSLMSMSVEADEKILESIAAIMALTHRKNGGQLSDDEMRAILQHADQIVTIAGTFGYEALEVATCSLCDLVDGLLRAGVRDIAPIAVHLQAMQLMGPDQPTLSPEAREKLFAELDKVRQHFDIESISWDATGSDLLTR